MLKRYVIKLYGFHICYFFDLTYALEIFKAYRKGVLVDILTGQSWYYPTES